MHVDTLIVVGSTHWMESQSIFDRGTSLGWMGEVLGAPQRKQTGFPLEEVLPLDRQEHLKTLGQVKQRLLAERQETYQSLRKERAMNECRVQISREEVRTQGSTGSPLWGWGYCNPKLSEFFCVHQFSIASQMAKPIAPARRALLQL